MPMYASRILCFCWCPLPLRSKLCSHLLRVYGGAWVVGILRPRGTAGACGYDDKKTESQHWTAEMSQLCPTETAPVWRRLGISLSSDIHLLDTLHVSLRQGVMYTHWGVNTPTYVRHPRLYLLIPPVVSHRGCWMLLLYTVHTPVALTAVRQYLNIALTMHK